MNAVERKTYIRRYGHEPSSAESEMTTEDRYLYGNVEAGVKVAARLRDAVEHLRPCEVQGLSGADDQLVLDALFSHEAYKRANAR